LTPAPERDAAAHAPSQAGAVSHGAIAGLAGGTLVAHALGTALRYAGAVVTTRILGLAAFGSFTLATTVTNVLSILSAAGLSPGLLPFVAEARRSGDASRVTAVVRAAWQIAGVASVLVALALWLASPWIARAIFGDPQMGEMLRVLSVMVVFAALSTVTLTLVQAFMGIHEQAWIERVLTVAVALVGLCLSWTLGLGVAGVLGATLLSAAVGLLAGYARLARRVPGLLSRRTTCDRLPTRALVGQSWPLLGTGLLAFALLWMDVLLMGVFRDRSEVGLYGACARLAPVILLVHDSVGPVFLARLSELFVHRDWPAIHALYKLAGRWSLWSGTIGSAVLIVWGAPILSLFGPGFVPGAPVLALLAASRLATTSTGMCGRMLAVTGRARLTMVNMSLLVGCNLALDLWWIPRHGAIGAAAATCLALVLINLVGTLEVWALYRVHPWTRRSVLGALAVAALAALAWPARDGWGGSLGWLVPLALFVLLSVGLYIVWDLGEEDRALLRALRARLWR